MNAFTMDDLQPLLDAYASPLLLFDGNTLLYCNQAGRALYPTLEAGADAESLLSPEALAAFPYEGGGSRIFFGTLLGLPRDFRVTRWKGYRLMELSAPSAVSADALSPIAQGILTPMTSVMSTTPELLRYISSTGSEKLQSIAAQFSQGIYSMLRAANHLRQLTSSQPSGGSPRNASICQWLSQQFQLLEPLVQSADRQLSLKLPPMDYICCFDPDRLGQALLNLISNAIKFTESGGHITLQLRKTSPKRLCISVQDDGCGIPPERLGAIFHPQSDAAPLPDPRWGMGLGLPLARSILQQHGGALVLESQVGQGTTVYLALPCASSSPEQPLHSTVRRPALYSGYSPALVELADVLPSSAFDFRDLDG